MKIAVIGDVHLGKAQKGLAEREDDIYDLFLRICKEVTDKKVDVVCILGDLFDSSHPPVKAISVALNAFENFAKNNIKVIIIKGNHDIPAIKTRMCPIDITKMNDIITELSTENPICSVNSNSTIVNICGVEYHPPEKRQSLIKTLENIREKISPSSLVKDNNEKNLKGLNILLLHQGLKEISPAEEEISVTDIPDIFKFVFVGHLHLRMEKDFGRKKVILPGSIEIGTVGDVVKQMHNKAKVIILDTEAESDNKIEKIEIDLSRKFIQKSIRSSAIDFYLKELANELKNSAVNGKLPWVYLEIEDDAKIGNSLINEKIARVTEGNVLFVQKEINSEEMNEMKKKTEISFKDINIREIIKGYFPKYAEDVYELYEKRRDIKSAKEVMNKIYDKFKIMYKASKIT